MQHLVNKPGFGARLDLSHPYNEGLVGCWLMNGQGWREPDLSPYGNHGILVEFTDPVYAGGQRSVQGIIFNSTSNYINCGNANSLNTTNAMTITARIYSNTSIGTQTIVSKYISDPNNSYELSLLGDKLRFILSQNGSYSVDYDYISTEAINTSVWNNIVAVYTGNNVLLYNNSIRLTHIKTLYPVSIYASNTNLSIGSRPTPDRYFNGYISEARIYNRALSADEIKQLYISPYAPDGRSLFI